MKKIQSLHVQKNSYYVKQIHVVNYSTNFICAFHYIIGVTSNHYSRIIFTREPLEPCYIYALTITAVLHLALNPYSVSAVAQNWHF